MPPKITFSIIGIITLGLAVAFLWGAGRTAFERSHQAPIPKTSVEKVNFKTTDNILIAADFYPASSTAAKGALLVHMMPADRTSWRDFAPQLVAQGYNVLAIDLRGHGESAGGPAGYRRFSDDQHQKSIADLDAGRAFLESKGVRRENLVLIGASIGANLVLQYLAENPEVRQAVLLSPGFDYRGIQTQPLMTNLKEGQRLFLVGSDDDSQSSAAVLNTLARQAPSGVEAQVLVYQKAGHGTNMFGKESPDLAQALISWLK